MEKQVGISEPTPPQNNPNTREAAARTVDGVVPVEPFENADQRVLVDILVEVDHSQGNMCCSCGGGSAAGIGGGRWVLADDDEGALW